MQEFREENSDQFEHQMRINNKAAGDLPGLASRQGNAEFQEDLLTKSNTVSHADSSSAASRGDTPSASRSASPGLPCVQESAPAETRAQNPPASAATPTGSAGSAVAPDHVASPTQPKTRLQSGIVKPKIYTDGTIRYANFCSTGEPENLTEAASSPKWKEVMENEITDVHKNKTCHLVPPQHGVNLIDCKWVFKVKLKANDTIDRHKARLVENSYKQ
jgi:hypothetical protein